MRAAGDLRDVRVVREVRDVWETGDVWDVREVNLAQWSLTDRSAIATKETNFVT